MRICAKIPDDFCVGAWSQEPGQVGSAVVAVVIRPRAHVLHQQNSSRSVLFNLTFVVASRVTLQIEDHLLSERFRPCET